MLDRKFDNLHRPGRGFYGAAGVLATGIFVVGFFVGQASMRHSLTEGSLLREGDPLTNVGKRSFGDASVTVRYRKDEETQQPYTYVTIVGPNRSPVRRGIEEVCRDIVVRQINAEVETQQDEIVAKDDCGFRVLTMITH